MITAITVQNTLGRLAVVPLPDAVVDEQLDAVLDDLPPPPPGRPPPRPPPADLSGMTAAALALRHRGAGAAVVTGGELAVTTDAAPGTDVLASAAGVRALEAGHVDTQHTRGAGTTFATAIAGGLASGYPVTEAVSAAKAYLSGR